MFLNLKGMTRRRRKKNRGNRNGSELLVKSSLEIAISYCTTNIMRRVLLPCQMGLPVAFFVCACLLSFLLGGVLLRCLCCWAFHLFVVVTGNSLYRNSSCSEEYLMSTI
mmetsp:Transcript_40967/g.45774  ORF Transcript_40967/g.45774 Transcript_40967/m.45774 type:complete len:109 (-) Transcript_40967:135-461(-)